MSKLEVDKIDPQSGTALEIGTSGDTVTVPSGVGLTLTDSTLLLPTTITSTTEVKTNKISPATGVAFALGDSGDTFTVPAGATIVNSGTATGFGGGKIGQVLQSSVITVNQTLTSTSFIDVTSVTIDITPSAASSTVLILAHIGYQGPSSSRYWNPTILRDSTNLGDSSEGFGRYYSEASGNVGTIELHYLDSPSTTSATTYKVQGLVQDASYSTVLNNFNQSYITVMEVLA